MPHPESCACSVVSEYIVSIIEKRKRQGYSNPYCSIDHGDGNCSACDKYGPGQSFEKPPIK